MFAYRNHPVARERMEKTEEVTTGAKPLRRKRNGIQIDCGGSGFCPDEGPWPTKAFIRPCSLADLEPPSPLHLFLGYPSARSQGPPGPKIIRLSLSPSPTTPSPTPAPFSFLTSELALFPVLHCSCSRPTAERKCSHISSQTAAFCGKGGLS